MSGQPAHFSHLGAHRRVGRYRYLVVAVVWLALFVQGFDRTGISVLIADPGFLRDMGLEGSPERQGLVMTALLIPYALSNIFVSPSADRWGPRRVLAAMAAVWSVAALLMGAAGSYAALLVGRAVRGIGEGPLFPVANRYVRNWFPPFERGGANGIWNSGQRLGFACSVPVLTAVIAVFGWRYSLFLQGALALVALLPAAWFLTGDRPELVPRVGAEERARISSGQPGSTAAPKWRIDLAALLGNRTYWLGVLYHFSALSVYFGLITWLPKYLKDGRGFDVGAMVLFATLPHIVSTLSGVTFGFLSDRLRRRAAFCAASMAGASSCVWLAALAPDAVGSALLIILGFGLYGAGPSAFFAMMQRIIPMATMATGIGIDNGIANLGSALAPTAVGFLIGATGSYLAGLLFLAGMGVVASVAALVLVARGY